MSPWITLLITLVIVVAILAALYFWGNKMQKKQAAQREQMMAAAQTASLLVIDKKRMKLKDAGLPKIVLEQAPKRFRNSKVPIVKAKVGPQIMSLLCDESIYDQIPVKKEVKAQISGIYIVGVKNIRSAAPVEPEKKGFMAKLRKKANDASIQMAENEKKK
ncbi:MAG: hypothetical protein ACI4CT_00195 [Lachnospiraceae bacterium]